MRRFKYGLNYQTINTGKFFSLVPLSYMEVAPGDTMSGTIQSRLFSDTTKVPIMNRAYWDLYAFYVPYRLLWDQFPDFIAGVPGAPTSTPVVTDTFPQNFENSFANSTVNSCAFQRYAYNLIYNKFFIPAGYESLLTRDLTATGLAQTPMRQSTLMESLSNETHVTETAIPTGNISDLRQAFASDRFDKVRQFYGSKYTDYLAAIGVEASWSILDEPEVIGQKHSSLGYRMVNGTVQLADPQPSGQIGDPGGYYDGVATLNIKRTFAPEHGLIVLMGSPKIDTLADNMTGPFQLSKISKDDYFQPEFMTERKQNVNRQVLGPVSVGGQGDQRLPIYEEYRKGQHLFATPPGTSTKDNLYYAKYTLPEDPTNITFNYRTQASIDNMFAGRLGGSEQEINYQVTSACKFSRNSPLRPDNSSKGVS